MRITVIPIVIGVCRTFLKGLVKGAEDLEIRGQVETIQIIKIGQNTESWRFERTSCHSNSYAGLKISQRAK